MPNRLGPYRGRGFNPRGRAGRNWARMAGNAMKNIREANALLRALGLKTNPRSRHARARRFVRRQRRTGVKKETVRKSKKGVPYHSSLQKMYNHKGMKFCVSHASKMFNVAPDIIEGLGEGNELYDIRDYADTYVITNNGTNGSHIPSADLYTGNEITYYCNFAPLFVLQNLGCWTDTSSSSPECRKLTNEVNSLRSYYKKWKLDQVSIRIKWKNISSQGMPLQIPDGYYALVSPKTITQYYQADGTVSTDVNTRNTKEKIQINAKEVLNRIYGVPPTQADNATESPGSWPRASAAHSEQQTEFTFDEVNESSKNGLIEWKKIPKSGLLTINHKFNSSYSRTTSLNGVPNNPVLLFVFRSNKQWLPPTQYTEHNDGTNISSATSLTTHVETGHAELPAVIADCETLFCYSFAERSESVENIVNTSARGLSGDKLPYFLSA